MKGCHCTVYITMHGVQVTHLPGCGGYGTITVYSHGLAPNVQFSPEVERVFRNDADALLADLGISVREGDPR